MTPQDKLRAYWSRTNSPTKPVGSTETEIARLEARVGVRLPDDFKAYLLAIAPSGQHVLDDNLIGWWNVSEIKSIPEEYPHDLKNPTIAENPGVFLFFADYCMWCWAWAIGCGEGEHHGKIAVVGGMKDRFVANSFSQFIDLYVADPSSVD
jgi:hypothetical protein